MLMSAASAALLDRIRDTPGYRRLTPAGMARLEEIVTSEPAHTVTDGALFNGSGLLHSDDLGDVVQFGSVGGELLFELSAALDPNSLFRIDQPEPRLRVHAHDRRGRKGWKLITPDYLNCTREVFEFVEVKLLASLLRLAATYPQDWVQVDGLWRYLPGEAAANAEGFHYRVFVADTLSKAFATNILLRWQIHRAPPAPLTPSQLAKVRTLLVAGPLTVARLCELQGGLTGGQLLQAIERGDLFGLLDWQIFEDRFLIFGSDAEAQRHASWLTASPIPSEPPGPYLGRLLQASMSELSYADRQFAKYTRDRLSGIKLNSTAYRQRNLLAAVAQEGAPPIAAFIPDFRKRGGDGRAIDETVRESIEGACKKYVKEAKGKRKPGGAMIEWEAAYPQYKDQISEETFRKLYHKTLSPERVALLSGGARSYHKTKPRTDGRVVNVRPEIPGVYVHLDGVHVDVLAKDGDGIFDRLIYFPMVDDVDGYVFARGVCTNRSSTLGPNMAICDCVQRHGRVPLVLLRDHGSENNNNQSPEQVTIIGNIFQYRPRSDARSGAMGESFNAALNEFAATLRGGMHFDAAGRAADGKKKARRHAIYTLDEIIRKIDHWIFEVWNKAHPCDSALSREQMFEQSLQRYPEAYVPFADGPLLRYQTGYPLRELAVDYQRGIRYAGKAYSSADLVSAIRLRKPCAGPRLDCLDPSVLWISDGTKPIATYSHDHIRMRGFDFAQRAVVYHNMEEYHRRAKANRKRRREVAVEAVAAEPVSVDVDRTASIAAPLNQRECPEPATTTWPAERIALTRFGDA